MLMRISVHHLENEIMDKFAIIKPKDPIGYFYHEPTMTNIAVYRKIPRLQLWFIKKCFGLEYRDIK